MFYAVIDTNILVSSLLKEDSYPYAIISMVDAEIITPLLHEDIVNEYIEVLNRSKFNFSKKAVNTIISCILNRGIFLVPSLTEKTFVDPKDKIFYEIVVTARKQSDVYLITGNIKHFPNESFIVSPKEMVNIYVDRI